MSSFRLRPRFSLCLPGSVDDVRERLTAALKKAGDKFDVKSFPGYLSLRVPEAEQHYWSPQLQISLDDEDGGTRLTGIYGPGTNMWASFLYGYLIVGSLGLFSGILGACQLCIGDSPWGLWIFGAMLAAAAGLYLSAQMGQKLAAWQTFQLHQVMEAAAGRSIEIS
jgi:hypothetical protein